MQSVTGSQIVKAPLQVDEAQAAAGPVADTARYASANEFLLAKLLAP